MQGDRLGRSGGDPSHSNAGVVALGSWDATTKEVFDKIVAAGTLAVLAPVFVCCWIYAKVTGPSKAPVTTVPRLGIGGEAFDLLNFSAPADQRKDRPLVKYGLIHLPELLNVLRGDMSLVGPRPRPVRPALSGRPIEVRLRPGMTGLWMLTPRTELTPQDIHSLDRTYVESWSLFRDIRILIVTAGAVRYGWKTT